MSRGTIPCLLLFSVVITVKADIYSHNPRGSNNRLNEDSAVRKNANRMFDSQNNNNGGYNVGDRTASPAKKAEDQYPMKYFQSSVTSRQNSKEGRSILNVEWTNQHGCGTDNDRHPGKRQCNIVLQYMCQKVIVDDQRDKIRDGLSTATQPFSYRTGYPKDIKTYNAFKNIVKKDFGLHERWDWYDKCYQREQNGGLFTADQKLTVKSGYIRSISTRQNSQGTRRGYECPEERDYYPYWHPTPWIDIAIFAQKPQYCSSYIRNSFNTRTYGECVEFYPDGKRRHASRWNNAFECKCHKGTWVQFSSFLEKAPLYKTPEACINARKTSKVNYIWGIPWDSKNVTQKECLVAPDKPLCTKAPYNRVNHLGNGMSGETNSFAWKLPHFPSGKEMRCVYRIRYNISTDDYDPMSTTSENNKDEEKGIVSPVEKNPVVKLAGQDFQLAINPAQFGRTFQDRSHVFYLTPRPKGILSENIYNLNVRGKRGNIVQVYPAVEYDFVPNNLQMSSKDLVHIQWTGSNTHKNKNKGNDGQGNEGTDRSNILEMKTGGVSYPLEFEDTTLWNNSKIVWIYHQETNIKPVDLALSMSSAGYYTCHTASQCPNSIAQDSLDKKKKKMDNLLNVAPASYAGALLSINKGLYNFMCTRNNEFTNRAQKGVILVK